MIPDEDDYNTTDPAEQQRKFEARTRAQQLAGKIILGIVYFALFVLSTVMIVYSIWINFSRSEEYVIPPFSLKDKSFVKSVIMAPWMPLALVDAYIHIFAITCWILYKEPRWYLKIFWVLMLWILGSPITCIYVIAQLLRLEKGEPIRNVLFRQRDIKRKSYMAPDW